MADNDVSPGILEQINQSIEANNASKRARNRLIVKADKGQAKYEDAYEYAGLRGKAAADAIREIEETDLPNGRMYFNIADKSIRPVLQKTGEDIYNFSSKILEKINEKAGFHLKPVLPDPEVLEDKVKGILDLASSAEHWNDVREEVAQTTENFSKKCVDDHIRANAEWQLQMGMSAKVVRTASHGACDWCSDIAGTYSYEAVRGRNDDVWRRHANCDCVIEYEPVKGKRQTVSSGSYRQNKDSQSPEAREREAERVSIEKYEKISNRELDKRISIGRNILNNEGIIAEKIKNGEYGIKLKHQKYLQHIKGTKQFDNAVRDRGRDQSYLIISESEAQKIIHDYAGLGLIKKNNNGEIPSREYISVGRIIGYYPSGGGFIGTTRVMIVYSKTGAHIVPVKEYGD